MVVLSKARARSMPVRISTPFPPFNQKVSINSTAGLGACGITSKDSDLIAAVSEELFDSFP